MFWGGLRGALALALIIIETPGYSDAVREFVGVLMTGFVPFTLFVNASTIGVVIRFFWLDRLSATDTALRDRALTLVLVLGRIGESIERVARRQDASGPGSGMRWPFSSRMVSFPRTSTGSSANSWPTSATPSRSVAPRATRPRFGRLSASVAASTSP